MFTTLGNVNRMIIGGEDPMEKNESQNDRVGDVSELDGPFEPTVQDVLIVKAMLQKACRLPIEIVDVIIDHAEYWPHSMTSLDYRDSHQGQFSVYGSTTDRENKFLLRCQPLGFVKPPHLKLDVYRTTDPEPRELEREYPVQKYQEWIGSEVPTIEHPCRKIVFTIKSRDQGWGGRSIEDHGTYRSTWTWFDVGLERFDAEGHCRDGCPDGGDDAAALKESGSPLLPVCSLCSIIPGLEPVNVDGEDTQQFQFDLLPSNMLLQSNVCAGQEWKEHRVEWSWMDCVNPDSIEAEKLAEQGRGKASANGEFVRNLKLGDVITVWAKARFPGWRNQIESIKVDVYWAV